MPRPTPRSALVARPAISRRSLLRAAGLTAVSGGALVSTGCSTPENVQPGSVRLAIADIPAGGGTIIQDSNYVVTNPAANQYRAFDRHCPHAGCLVSDVRDREIVCACHGSHFSVEDGSALRGPAASGLAEAPLTQDGDSVVVGG